MWSKYFLSFLLMTLLPVLSYGNILVLSGEKIAVYSSDSRLLFPFFTVDHDHKVFIEDSSIELVGLDKDAARKRIRDALSSVKNIQDIRFFNPQDLTRFTVLGDLKKPGRYWVPDETAVDDVNAYNALFDATGYKATYTLVRAGTRQLLTHDLLKTTVVNEGDILLVSLVHHLPKPVEPALVEEVSSQNIIKEAPLDSLQLLSVTSKESLVDKVKESQKEPRDVLSVIPIENTSVDVTADNIVETNMHSKEELESENHKSHGQSAEAIEETNTTKSADRQPEPSPQEVERKTVLETTHKKVISPPIESPILHPGDILRIDLPGEKEFDNDFLISRDGTIKLPEVGNLVVSGTTLAKTEKAIKERLSEAFIRLEKLSVTLKEQRLLVSVLGYVEKPGEVELKKNSNVQTAINAAGGMVDGAQLDRLQLRRGEEVIEFNYKKYLDTGNPDLIPELQPLDEIFVPASPQLGNILGQTGSDGVADAMDPTQDRSAIKVFGEVGKPTTFPFKKNMTVVDALLLAGGVTRYANVEQIRVIDSSVARMFDLKGYLDSGDKENLPILSEGATIFVPKQVDAVKSGGRVVYVMGQVQKPGAFETGENVNFLDVLANAGGPNRYADTRRITILRYDGDVVGFNLQDYSYGEDVEMPEMMPGDAIFVPEKDIQLDRTWLKLDSDQTIHLLGAVTKPGRYEYDTNITFMDLLSHAGGPNERADLTRVKIIEKGPNGEASSREFDLESFLENGGNWNLLPKLEGGLTVVFPELPESPTDNKANWLKLTADQSIYIMGSVVAPGRYAFNDQLDLLDLLSAAEGPKEDADLANVRIVHRNGVGPKVSKLNLVDYFETGDETLLPSIEVGDTIFVPSRNRSWVEKKQEQTVRVLGAVKRSGRYEFTTEMSILDILAEAGGASSTAYIEKIIIVNVSRSRNASYTFDLMDFMKQPDASKLPVIRPGDTIFVPDVSDTQYSHFMGGVKDVLNVFSLFNLTKEMWSGAAK